MQEKLQKFVFQLYTFREVSTNTKSTIVIVPQQICPVFKQNSRKTFRIQGMTFQYLLDLRTFHTENS